jgi:hypothetical protein
MGQWQVELVTDIIRPDQRLPELNRCDHSHRIIAMNSDAKASIDTSARPDDPACVESGL